MAHSAAGWLLALALVAAAPVHAVDIGAPEVGSALGEPLDVRIPLRPAPGERFEGACFSVSHPPLGEGQRVTLALERSARGAALRVRSSGPVSIPAATLTVQVACPGREAQPPHDVAVLLDPRQRVRAPQLATAAPAIGAAIRARDAATLATIARQVFPSEAPARSGYLEALRAANPEIAARGDDTPIPEGAQVALPDLRTFAATRRAAARGAVPSITTAPPPASSTAREMPVFPKAAPVAGARPRTEASAPPPAPKAVEARVVAPAARTAAAPASMPETKPAAAPPSTPASKPAVSPLPAREPAFVLRLSGAEMDLTRSRGIDDRRRSQLRERQLLLDQDDQVSALLAMRNNLKQLEARVSELQLKLAGMPAVFPDRPAPAKAAAADPAPATPPTAADVPKPSLPTTAPKAESTTTPSTTAAPIAVPAPAAAPVAPTVAAAPSPAAPTPAPAPPSATAKPTVANPVTAPAKPAPEGSRLGELARDYGWYLVGLMVAVIALLGLGLWRRRRAAVAAQLEEDQVPEIVEARGPVGEIAAPVSLPTPAGERAVISSDAHLPTRLRDADSGDLRRRYIEERFPEVASGTIRLEDTDSVVKAARLFYEDGELPRTIELLHLAIEARPEEQRLWLALFEIFRLERLEGEFAELARRFHARHGDTEAWRKVQYFGREVEPGNALYKAEPVNTLETIGPREARRLAAQKSSFDPIAENWLDAPMDFENEVLANDLRRSLMAAAGIAEQDLQPQPRAALRNVEMFTVA